MHPHQATELQNMCGKIDRIFKQIDKSLFLKLGFLTPISQQWIEQETKPARNRT